MLDGVDFFNGVDFLDICVAMHCCYWSAIIFLWVILYMSKEEGGKKNKRNHTIICDECYPYNLSVVSLL